jgi:hypothetical protein
MTGGEGKNGVAGMLLLAVLRIGSVLGVDVGVPRRDSENRVETVSLFARVFASATSPRGLMASGVNFPGTNWISLMGNTGSWFCSGA